MGFPKHKVESPGIRAPTSYGPIVTWNPKALLGGSGGLSQSVKNGDSWGYDMGYRGYSPIY